MPDLITPAAAFALGAALARANSCTVASARRLVVDRRADWLIGLAVATSWAGLTLGLFAFALPHVVVLPAQIPLGGEVVLGGVLLGIGAALNQGCFLGSIGRLGRGDLPYFFTLCGIALAMAFMPMLSVSAVSPMPPAKPAFRDAGALFLASLVFAPVALLGLVRWWRRSRQTPLALIMVGIAGGTVYACNPGWSYSSGLYRIVSSGGRTDFMQGEIGTLAVIAGVIVSAALAGRFELRIGTTRAIAARLGGGILMGAGAMLVPGGNDTLMLWAIPGLTIYGPLAYAIMIATIMAVLVVSTGPAGSESSAADHGHPSSPACRGRAP